MKILVEVEVPDGKVCIDHNDSFPCKFLTGRWGNEWEENWCNCFNMQVLKAEKLPQCIAAEVKPECHCDLRTKLVGDGCSVCNPLYMADMGEDRE